MKGYASTGMTEMFHVSQASGEPRRRWFRSARLDLVVWFGDAEVPVGFQISYDKEATEHAPTWQADVGFSHTAVDDGEAGGGLRYKATPILVDDRDLDMARLTAPWATESAGLPEGIARFIAARLREYPSRTP